jgi:hypothetical protein
MQFLRKNGCSCYLVCFDKLCFNWRKEMNPMIKKSLIASSVALTLGAANAQAALVTDLFGANDWSTDRANFTMLDGGGFTVGGTNDVSMLWDGNGYSDSSDYTGPGSAANVTASSTTAFFGHTWTAHDIQVFVPGSYSFDVQAGAHPNDTETAGFLTATVGAGQLGMHMLFNWNTAVNIDVFVVANPSSMFATGDVRSADISGCDSTALATHANCLWDGPGFAGGLSANKPVANQVWMMASTDGNGDTVMGIPMPAGGPFEGFNANFNATMSPTPDAVVPVPAAVWLFGSGLLGLVGVARRKKKA